MAALQVLQRGVCDQWAVVELDHLQTVVSAGATAEVSDAVISDQLTVRQTLQGVPRQERHYSNICDVVLVNATGLAATHTHTHSPGLANEGSGWTAG